MKRSFAAWAVGVVLCSLSLPASASAPKTATAEKNLKICASTKEPPFSTADGQGFENRIARVVAAAMDRKADFVWAKKPAIYLVRDFLNKNACDVVIGLDVGDPRVLTTKPYYRSGYVFLTRADRHLDITSWHDSRIPKMQNIALSFGSPADVMLHSIGLYANDESYLYSLVNFRSRRNQYVQVVPSKIVSEVASGHADLGVAFAPAVARYVKASSVPLTMTMIPDNNKRSDGQPVPFHFSEAMGVRKNDPALRRELNQAINKAMPKINKILDEEGIPRLAKGQ